MPNTIKSLRTRNENKRYAGLPSDLPVSDLPTYRQVVQYSYFILKNINSVRNINSPKIVSKVASDLIDLWIRVNPKLPLIHEKSVTKKCFRLFIKVLSAEGKFKNSNKNKEYLDCNFERLFDLSSCNCGLPVIACNDNVGTNQIVRQHIFACFCEVNKKVPLLDREYLKDQKLKIGTIGRFQIGTIDKKAVAIEKRKRDREINQQIKSANSLAPEIQCDHYMDCDLDNKNDSETDPDYSITAPAERNQTYLTNLAKAAIRYEISDVATAALATAVLIDYGIVKKSNKAQIITEKKIFGEKKRISSIISSKHLADVKELEVIGVDGKKNKFTLTHSIRYNSNGDPVVVAAIKEEYHLTFTAESGPTSQSYLTHVVIPNGIGATMANATANVLLEFNSVQSLIAVILDNTSSNTGCDSGLVVKLEKIINKNLHLLGCLLHQNELPLRHIISELDGKTVSPNSFKGPIGEAASNLTLHEQPLFQFVPIKSEVELFVSKEIISDLSTDQRKLYEYCVGISKGFISERFVSKKTRTSLPCQMANFSTQNYDVIC
nr:uncharacterized protein LOC124806288 [Hydra vulgaris]